MKRGSPVRLKGRPRNLLTDRFLEVRGDHLGGALKAAGLTLQATSARLAELGTPISFPVLSRLIGGSNKRTRGSILKNIATLTPGIPCAWLSGELDAELDEALAEELDEALVNELEPSRMMAVPVTLTYIVERQRLTDEIQIASRRDAKRELDWLYVVGLALSLSHARDMWRGKADARSRRPVREFNEFATMMAHAWRLKLGPWLAGTERLRPREVVRRHKEISNRLVWGDSGDAHLLTGFPPLPVKRGVKLPASRRRNGARNDTRILRVSQFAGEVSERRPVKSLHSRRA